MKIFLFIVLFICLSCLQAVQSSPVRDQIGYVGGNPMKGPMPKVHVPVSIKDAPHERPITASGRPSSQLPSSPKTSPAPKSSPSPKSTGQLGKSKSSNGILGKVSKLFGSGSRSSRH